MEKRRSVIVTDNIHIVTKKSGDTRLGILLIRSGADFMVADLCYTPATGVMVFSPPQTLKYFLRNAGDAIDASLFNSRPATHPLIQRAECRV
jgi:hypothetical protein